MGLTLKIVRSTYLKRSPFLQASELGDAEKVAISQGEFKIHSYCEEGNHFRVAFFETSFKGFNTWYVFPSHVQILQDGKVIYPAPLIKLPVRYQSQLDNSYDPYGTCNTSASFAGGEFIKPGVCNGSDDYFLWHFIVNKGRQSTNHAHMTAALAEIGVKSSFHYNLTLADLDDQLRQGMPMVIGILHHGTEEWPEGNGHMILVIGKDGDDYFCHDPYGKFPYQGKSGECVRYSKRMLKARWQVWDAEGDDGWGRIFYR